jgi:hypothetical protein
MEELLEMLKEIKRLFVSVLCETEHYNSELLRYLPTQLKVMCREMDPSHLPINTLLSPPAGSSQGVT